jgi:hypothetical protein
MKVVAILVALIAVALLAPLAVAQGGPPFRSDDPATPGNKHWEINVGLLADRKLSEGSYSLPNIDINYVKPRRLYPLGAISVSRDASSNGTSGSPERFRTAIHGSETALLLRLTERGFGIFVLARWCPASALRSWGAFNRQERLGDSIVLLYLSQASS